MVRVVVVVDSDECLVKLSATGHVGLTGGPHGGNVVCAAVTGVIKACATALAENPAVAAEGSAPFAGNFLVRVVSAEQPSLDWLRGVTDVLLAGLRLLAVDSPSEIELSVERKRS